MSSLTAAADSAGGCQRWRPLVVSHLGSFYESPPADAAEFETSPTAATRRTTIVSEAERLLPGRSGERARTRCSLRASRSTWQCLLWAGGVLLALGAAALLAVLLTPRRPTVAPAPGAAGGGGDGFARLPGNAAWNRRLEAAGFLALSVFALGGLLVAAGLLLPSVAWRLFDDNEVGDAVDCGTKPAGPQSPCPSPQPPPPQPPPTGPGLTVQPPRMPEGQVRGGAVRAGGE